ncbi:hypothetical protein ACFQ4O_05575 [Methylopila musalis]|uniref:Uncharacterized protein n=1 Tax=Methylopila musalis TaxID=1134781 RepID=A0ABW3Z6I4_9HYPH
MTKSAQDHAPARRSRPPARLVNPRYEIDFRRRPSPSSLARGLASLVQGGLGRAGEVFGDAYAAAARVLLERKELVEDRRAERRDASRAPTDAAKS